MSSVCRAPTTSSASSSLHSLRLRYRDYHRAQHFNTNPHFWNDTSFLHGVDFNAFRAGNNYVHQSTPEVVLRALHTRLVAVDSSLEAGGESGEAPRRGVGGLAAGH